MNVEIFPGSIRAIVHGNPLELDALEEGLSDTRDSPTWKRESNSQLAIMLGTILATGMADPAPSAMPNVRRDAETLWQAGILRQYQAEAVVAALEASYGLGIIKVPTGGGKTEIAAGIVACASASEMGPWVYTCPSSTLARQTEARFATTLAKMAKALGCAEIGQVTCCGFETADDSKLEKAYGIIVDECHRIAASTYAPVLLKTFARARVGLSATPTLRSDRRNSIVTGLLGPIVYQVTMQTLIELGYIAEGKIEVI